MIKRTGCEYAWPQAFTNVAMFRDWIDSVVGV